MAQERKSFFGTPQGIGAEEDLATPKSAPAPVPAHTATHGSGASAFGRSPKAAPTTGKKSKARPATAPTPSPSQPDDMGRLKRLGFQRPAECLMVIPKGYNDYTQPIGKVSDRHINTKQYFVLQAREMRLFSEGKQRTTSWMAARRLEIDCVDEAGLMVRVSMFGFLGEWRDRDWRAPLHLYGALELYGPQLFLSKVEWVPESTRGRVVPQYVGIPGSVTGESVREAVDRAWPLLEEAEVLLLAHAGLRESEFTDITGIKRPASLLQALHRPRSVAQGLKASELARRLSAETVVRRAAMQRQRHAQTHSAIPITRPMVDQLISELPFPLTNDQRVAIDEIVNDLRSPYPLKRLLSGDVGTGKSVTFMVPAAAAYMAGANVGVVAPTELLVDQIARELQGYYPDLPVCRVVAGEPLTEGIAVGTTALLHAAKRCQKRFHLVITDEQHKFSTQQKAALASSFTNTLEATATAIPRSLALVSYGDMDVSVLRECPVAKSIDTKIVNAEEIQKVANFVQRVVNDAGQVAIIYPLVEKGATTDPQMEASDSPASRQGVMEGFEEWNARFPGRVGVLHGKQSSEEKAEVIAAMKAKKIDVLVSTLVLEVGVTLPSLKALLVTSPERFGLSQLHQLRGRVARHGGHGWMLMLARPGLSDESMARLQTLRACNDGFTLAEHDMNMRGFGDVSLHGTAQVGGHRALFHNTALTHTEIKASAQRLGMRV